MATELWRLDAVERAEMIRRRAVSCREVLTAALARLDGGAAVPPVQPGGRSVKGSAAEGA
jgi:hypothetical protein